MGDVSEWLPALIVMGSISAGLGVLLLFALDPTRTNINFAITYIAVGVANATPWPLVNEVAQHVEPGGVQVKGLSAEQQIFAVWPRSP